MLKSIFNNRILKIDHNRILFLILGILIGYLILHPYTMLVYTLTHASENHGFHFKWDQFHQLWEQALMAFHPNMLPMSISFMLFGGVIGMLLGIIFDRRKKLLYLALEDEKKRVALKTLKELIVTLSHHLLNSNMIIGGKVRHCRKTTSNEDILVALDVIEEQGHKIDAVIKSLREVSEVKTVGYTTSENIRMIDIAEDIEENLRQKKSEITQAGFNCFLPK